MDVHKSLAGLIFRGVGGIKLKSHCLSCTNCNGACKNVFVVQQLLMDVDKSLAVLIGSFIFVQQMLMDVDKSLAVLIGSFIFVQQLLMDVDKSLAVLIDSFFLFNSFFLLFNSF